MRLFAALPIPPVAVERISALRLRFAAPGDRLRWSTPEQWHITLRFMGDLDSAKADELITALRGLDAQKVNLTLDELGVFATKGILFAHVQPSASLLELQQAVQRIASSAGLPPELWPFRPHITLCRSKGEKGHASLLRLSRPSLPGFGAPICWRAEHLVLHESLLENEGAIFKAIAEIPLLDSPEVHTRA